jgi:PEP-CTERM motif-containing protein
MKPAHYLSSERLGLKAEAKGELMKRLGLVVALLVMAAVPSWAAPLHIGTGFGTACAQGCAGHPNLIDDPFSIFVNGAGQGPLSNPLMLIIGVPDFGAGTAAPTLTGVEFFNESAGPGVAVTFASLGLAGSMGPGQEAYTQAGFTGGNNSNSFVNWSPLDPGVVEFDLYKYRINQSVDGSDLLNVSWNAVQGSFVIAFGCEGLAGEALDGSCNARSGNGDLSATPITESGHVNVPEPTTLLLLVSGLVGTTCLARRRGCPR